MNLFEQFQENIPDQAVEVSDKSNLFQCMDLAYLWVFCLGYPKATIQRLHAYEVFTHANDLTKEYFEIIPNSATFIPQQGDLGIFDKTVGESGHICICTGQGDLKKFVSLDQNWNGVQRATLTTHTYKGFIGVLRPKKTISDTPSLFKYTEEDMTKMRLERDANDRLFKDEKESHQKDLTDIAIALGCTNTVPGILARVKTLTDNEEDSRKIVSGLRKEIEDLKNEKSDYLRPIDELRKQNEAMLKRLGELENDIATTQQKESLLDRLFKFLKG